MFAMNVFRLRALVTFGPKSFWVDILHEKFAALLHFLTNHSSSVHSTDQCKLFEQFWVIKRMGFGEIRA